jgi:broad specificity phosphatase PhoE
MGTLLLVRHGQASFGAQDYDQLSEHGREQAAVVGAALAAREVTPSRIVTGSLRRQRDTADLTARAAGWAAEPEVDPRWDEFSSARTPGEAEARRQDETVQQFASRFDSAIDRWFTGEQDWAESFGEFLDRVVSGLEAARPGSGETHVVFTSSGAIAAVAAHLLGEPAIWPRLNRVTVNCGVTTVVSGRRGMSLVAFNDHGHLAPKAVTYR